MKTLTRLFPLLILSVPATATLAADTPVDTAEWKCKFCTFEEGFTGSVDVGFGHVSTDSYKFGEYTGLNKQGGFLIGNAELRARGDNANYWNIDASNLGLDSRALGVEGGRQGTYKLTFQYSELPHFISDSTATPFLGTGTGSLTLPGTWVRAGTTGGMTDMANSLHAVDLETSRKRLGLGVMAFAGTRWEFAVNVRHEAREGTQRTAGSFFFNSTQLIMPIDTVTQQLDASASYSGRKLQTRFAYYISQFSNNNTALNWDNPYSAGGGGPDAGQLALPPDNQFHQLLASVGYQFIDQVRATADIAFGRMTQNQPFLAATVNPSLVVPALPRSSLDGQVDTLNANLKLTAAVTDRLRLNASYTYNDHDNKTPQASYSWVSTDTFLNLAPRTNLPYSFTQGTLKLSGDYRFTAQTRASLGADNDTRERTYQEVSKTRENTIWGKVRTRALGDTDFTLKAAHAERGVDGYVLSWLSPAENPLMQKYNMADRNRDTVGARADVAVWQVVNLGFGVDFAKDEYANSQIGLTESRDVTYSADASAALAKATSLHAYFTREKIDSLQAGSSSASTPDWTGENNDVVDTAGLGVKHALIKGKLDIGADYTVSYSRGQLTIQDGTASPPFPDLISKLSLVKLHATYRLKDNMSLSGTYWYEHYKSENWQLNGVTPSTISNVLALGEQPPSFYANVVMLSLRYRF